MASMNLLLNDIFMYFFSLYVYVNIHFWNSYEPLSIAT